MSFTPSSPQGLSPDDALPSVEPPSAGFILQLFVVPGIIVVVVVMIWVMFNWLAQMGNDRDAFVRALARNNEARWQAAFNLANALRAERGSTNPKLTGDPELAKQLAGILDREIEAGSMNKNPITLRIYLCRALGEFKVVDGLPTLIKAAMTQRSDDEADVRRAALEGIALLAANVGATGASFSDDPRLSEALNKAAADSEPRTRAAAAVAMGVIGGQPFLDRLHVMVEDLNPDVRYNAATRLAHYGDIAAVSVLLEMLDPDEQAGVELENEKDLRPFKRAVITINALRATAQLAEKNPNADLTSLTESIEKLLSGNVNGEIRIDATGVLRQLRARSAKS
ncbi:MAG: HEAT repeat domain-containing protein [Planctomycetia bacterium]|nr:HEAT repeat domain-containing protein [Planctomycetia bacterium]